MLILIDNYDSFTYNLYQLVGTLTKTPIKVLRNDELTASDLQQLAPTGLLFSPGPGRPENAGNMPKMLKTMIGKVPILGVCLGEQAIVQAYGGHIINAPELMHGKTSTITQTNSSALFAHCPKQFTAARYHSLVAENRTLPQTLTVTAVSDNDGCIMAVENAQDRVYGVQFHPESIMTDAAVGKQIALNFLEICHAEIATVNA